jgi:16S rRNA (uracil1498-N3)-methyltransferase
MKQLRLPLPDLAPGERELSGEASRYVSRVHRLGVGDRLLVFDPASRLEADAEVEAVGRRVVLRVAQTRTASRVATRDVTVIQAIGKGAKLDAVVRDATELGATRVVPALAVRSVKRRADVERLRRIALEAARQCGRGDMPEVVAPLALDQAFAAADDGVRIVLHPDGDELLGAALKGEMAVTVAIGPEGGFTDDELKVARAAGFVVARFGAFVLRTETACAAILGAIVASSAK